MSAMDTLTVLKELMNMTTAVLTITNIMVDMLIIVMNPSKSTPLWNIILEVDLDVIRIPTVKLKILGQGVGKAGYRTSVTFKL